MNFKRILTFILAIVLTAAAFGSCENTSNEDQNTLTIQYSRGISVAFMDALKEKFPEVSFVYEFYQGGNYTEYLNESLTHGVAADIIAHTVCMNGDVAAETLHDLSGYTFLGNFDNAIIDTMAQGAYVYQLPGPVSTRCIFYNKTLFDMYGWEAPSTFNELLALVKQIRTDAPDITPLAMSMVAPGYPFTIVSSFAQCGFLSSPDGADWEKRYFEGAASVGEGFDEGLTMVEKLIDANAFDGEKYGNVWNVVAGDPCERKAAMTFSFSGTLPILPLLEKSADPELYGEYCNDDFGLLPFFGLNDGQEGLSIVLSSTWGINKRLEQKGNEKKLENALKVMEFIASEEGQLLLQTDNGQIPTLKNLENTNLHPEVLKLWQLGDSGKKTVYLYSGYEDIIVDGGQIVADAILADSSEGMRERFVEVCDEIHEKALQGQTGTQTYGVIEETLTIEQTSALVMSAIKQKCGADITLATYRDIKNGVINSNGVGGRFFEGDVIELSITIVLSNYNINIQTASVTGAEIKELLKKGKAVTSGESTEYFEYIAYGLDITETDGEITSVKFNGAELEDDKTYTVCFSQSDYDTEFSEAHEITDTGLAVFDAISEYLKANGPITADKIK